MRDDLGPLPQSDRQDTLQQLSIKQFRNALPEDQFLFRDERVDDKGVDGSLEVKIDGKFTNCRGQVQLKSTDADPSRPGTFNKDGSYSESVATSNLNYLLHGPSPLYVIWFSKVDELRFVWARDVRHDLDVNNPDWMLQTSFTIRFLQTITIETLATIHRRILDEARFDRRIHETLSRSAPAETVVVSISANNLESTDPALIHEQLLQNGMTIVSSGYGKQVLEWYAILNPCAAKKARLCLIAAYAATSISKYHEAKAYLASVAPNLDQLEESDRHFWEHLGDVCDYHTGRIDRMTYLAREANWATHGDGIRAKEYKLEILRMGCLRERDPARRAEQLREVRVLTDSITSDPNSRAPQRIQARLVLLAVEGNDLDMYFIEMIAKLGMRTNMGFSAASMAANAAQDETNRWTAWERKAAELRHDAIEARHPLLIADVMTTRLVCYLSFLLLRRMNAMAHGIDQRPNDMLLKALTDDANQAIVAYHLAGSLSGELQTKILLADLYNVYGHDVRAKELANSVMPIARAMNYERLVSQANDHLTEHTVLHQFQATIAEIPNDDVIALSMDDSAVKSMALMTLQALGIPSSRLMLVEKDILSGRVIAQERRDWCRHIELLQDLAHTMRPETAYKFDPVRSCKCMKFGYESNIRHTDYEGVISGFKGAYCNHCKAREPGRAG